MNASEVRRSVDDICRMCGDDEAAHAAEDALHVAVLRAIAAGCADPVGLAVAALETTVIKFERFAV